MLLVLILMLLAQPSVPVVPNHLAGTDPTSISICALREAVHGCDWLLALSLYQALGKNIKHIHFLYLVASPWLSAEALMTGWRAGTVHSATLVIASQ